MANLFFTYRFLYLYVINQVICVKVFYSIRSYPYSFIFTILNDRRPGPEMNRPKTDFRMFGSD